ncbi:MAG: hypothetical protein HY347_03530 [candidate division NC10 bacterium]|nr:hypothetical protein [candidate division NC10 bacterium]
MKISAREKRFLIIGGIAILLFVLIRWGVGPAISGQQGVQDRLALKRELLERYQRILEEKRLDEKRLKALQEVYAGMQKRLFSAEKPGVVTSELQAILQKLAQASGVEVRTVRFLPPKKMEVFTRIAVELNFGATVRDLKEFLYRIEAHERLLLIPRMVIVAGSTPLAQVTMEVAGFTPLVEESAEGQRAGAPRRGV